MRSAVSDAVPRIDGRDERDTPTSGRGDVEAAIVASVRAAAGGDALAAVGVAAPGPLDHREGVVHEAPNLRGFTEVHLAADLRGELGVPVFVDRDTVVAAIGESRFGAARGARDFVYVTISTGIGGAIVTDGRILRGVTGTAGEIGHWQVDPDGPACGCGARGCVEALASGGNIAKRYGAQSAPEVFAAAERGDRRARAILEEARGALAALAVMLVNVINPALIVVGGGVATGAPEFVLGTMRDAIGARAFRVPAAAVRVVPAALGDDVGPIGALALAMERAAGREPLG